MKKTAVKLPAEYLRWVLSQSKDDYRVPTLEDDDDHSPEEIAALQLAYDDFAGFRGWVRRVLDGGGRVTVGGGGGTAGVVRGPRAWQKSIDREWAKARQELAAAAAMESSSSCHGDRDVGEEMTTPSPLGPNTYMLSVYLCLIYQSISMQGRP